MSIHAKHEHDEGKVYLDRLGCIDHSSCLPVVLQCKASITASQALPILLYHLPYLLVLILRVQQLHRNHRKTLSTMPCKVASVYRTGPDGYPDGNLFLSDCGRKRADTAALTVRVPKDYVEAFMVRIPKSSLAEPRACGSYHHEHQIGCVCVVCIYTWQSLHLSRHGARTAPDGDDTASNKALQNLAVLRYFCTIQERREGGWGLCRWLCMALDTCGNTQAHPQKPCMSQRELERGQWHQTSDIRGADREMVAGNGQVRAVLPQLCLVAHVLCSPPEVLAHQQDHHIHQRLGSILAEEVGPQCSTSSCSHPCVGEQCTICHSN